MAEQYTQDSMLNETLLDDVREKLIDIEKSLLFVANHSASIGVKSYVSQIAETINGLGRHERNGLYQAIDVISSLNES